MQTITNQLASVEVAAPAVVSIVLLTRLYFGSVIFSPRYAKAWNILRRILVPLVDTLAASRLPTSPSLTNRATEEEFVCRTGLSIVSLGERLSEVREAEVPLLAGYKTDWQGRKEDGTLVWYYGPRPWPTAPNWLRPHQVHITTFGGTITAHREANPYCPWMWADHLFKGQSFSVDDGVDRTRRALDDAGVEYDTGLPEGGV